MRLVSSPSFSWLAFFLVLLPTAVASGAAEKPKQAWHWLSEADRLQLLQSIPAAPVPGSAQDQQDLQAVLQAQAGRTRQDIAEAWFDRKFQFEMVTNVLDPNFTAKNDPVTFALLENTMQDESSISYELKKKYRRPRPYRAHPEVKALFPVDQYSYPSGHAAGSFVLAAVLGELFPDKKSALMARADAVARSRVIAGVHYPSDIEQGKVLGQAIMNAFLTNAAFQRDLAAAKSEIAAKKSGG
jgi:acid phosphatase (class A)